MAVALIILAFIALLAPLLRMLTIRSRQVQAAELNSIVVAPEAVARLAQALRIPTVSETGGPSDPAPFRELHALLATSYPLCHRLLQREIVNGASLLYTWPGADIELRPALFAAHLDVVPVDPQSAERWRYAPFAGEVAEDCIWGRGALDDKSSLIALLEAAEILLAGGFWPKRTLYFAFGHDEELAGTAGAAHIATLLQERRIALEFVLDEGLLIIAGRMPGLKHPVAYIGVAEKGYMDIELSVETAGGHASEASCANAVAILSRALVRVGRRRFPARMERSVAALCDYLAPEMPWHLRAIFANHRLLRPLLAAVLGRRACTAALFRTTVCPTMLEGSPKSNMLPRFARAVLNARVLPGETLQSVIERMRGMIDDPRVTVRPIGFSNAGLAASPTECPAFRLLQASLAAVFPGVLAAPCLMIAGTDSKRYAGLTNCIYRFTPVELCERDLEGFHGINERLALSNFPRMIRFYADVMARAGAGGILRQE